MASSIPKSSFIMSVPLTAGAVKYFETLQGDVKEGYHPVVQIVNIVPVQQNRYKVGVTDGTDYIVMLLASQVTSLVLQGQLAESSIIKLGSMVCPK